MIGRGTFRRLDHHVEEDAFIIVVGEDERHRQLARAHRGAVDAPDHQMLAALLEHQLALCRDVGAQQRLHRHDAIFLDAFVHFDALREVGGHSDELDRLRSALDAEIADGWAVGRRAHHDMAADDIQRLSLAQIFPAGRQGQRGGGKGKDRKRFHFGRTP